jgi:acetyl-CoA carboxylase carboxyl transferase subunit alpha
MSKAEHILEFEKPIRTLEERIRSLEESSRGTRVDLDDEVGALRGKLQSLRETVYAELSPWQRVQIARHPQRPTMLDYVPLICSRFEELHGDRSFRDDAAIVGGVAVFEGRHVMLIGHQKGRDTRENLRRNFGCPHPEGYRKALRLMRQADKFGLPILTLVDTPGAYPGIGAEERHVAEAIAVNLREMSQLRVPIVSVIIGEGGSGGALGIAVANHVSIFENAYYSVISPEGCAAILWKDRAAAASAAQALKLCSGDLEQMGIVDAVVAEPMGGAHKDVAKAAEALRTAIVRAFRSLDGLSGEALIEHRYERFRKMGDFMEAPLAVVCAD